MKVGDKLRYTGCENSPAEKDLSIYYEVGKIYEISAILGRSVRITDVTFTTNIISSLHIWDHFVNVKEDRNLKMKTIL